MYSITFPTFSFKEKSEASLRSKLQFKTRCSLRISRFFFKRRPQLHVDNRWLWSGGDWRGGGLGKDFKVIM